MPKKQVMKTTKERKKIENNDSKEQRGDHKLIVKEHGLNDFAVRKSFPKLISRIFYVEFRVSFINYFKLKKVMCDLKHVMLECECLKI